MPVMACNSLFMTSSLRLFISNISSLVRSRVSMKDRSSASFFLPNWLREVEDEGSDDTAALDWIA